MKKTITEAELRRMVESGMTHREIGAALGGRHYATVAAACAIFGIRSPSGNGRIHDQSRGKHDLDAYVSEMLAGMTIQEIAEKRGLKNQTVIKALKRAGLPTCTREAIRAKCAPQSASTTYTADRFASFVPPLAS